MNGGPALYKDLDAVAIIGFSGKFPGATNVDVFWKNLVEGKECIEQLPEEELIAAGVDSSDLNNPQYVKAGAFLEDVEFFDAEFFGYNPREAEYADPQQRHLLECAWTAFEHAGYDIERFRAPVGVFVSGAMSTYLIHMIECGCAESSQDRLAALLGNDKDSLSTILSYRMNLKGPSYSIQSHCSSSLVAVHTACQSLLDHECDVAISGGVTIRVPHRVGYFHQPGSINSPDGHCRPFDANAQGTVFGNGVGLVVLKRVEDAVANRDAIYAVIRGSAINNDGRVKAGYTAPSVAGQASVISEALAMADVDPKNIDYVEAHGTGTALGDPTEMAALKKVFSESLRTTSHLVGSCKSNIGHLDTASGIAGLIKLTLMLHNKRIPASLNFKTPSSEIDFSNSPFSVNTEDRAWDARLKSPRFAGISSFGVGGTNAHMVLMEGIRIAPLASDATSHLLPVSARSEKALSEACANLAGFRFDSEYRLRDVAFTLQEGRKAFPYRKFVVVDRLEDIESAFGEESDVVFHEHFDGAPPSVAFLFPGQGAQHLEMGKGLYEGERVFRESLDQCCEILLEEGIDLLSLMYPNTEDISQEQAIESLSCTAIAQPALFSIEYSMAKLWMSWGVKPSAFIGHSIGEFVGACLSGVMSFASALKLVAFRGRIMNEQQRGAMLSLDLTMEEAVEFANDDIVVAASNAPRSTVLAGSLEGIEALSEILTEREISFKPIKTSHAFHSPLMDEAVDAFAKRTNEIILSAPKIPIYSNVSGMVLSVEEATDPFYWARQLRERVLFSQCLNNALSDGHRIMLEVGPGQTLSSLARHQALFADNCRSISSMPHVKADKNGRKHVLESLGRLWLSGVSIDWAALHKDSSARRVALPTYPFQRSRYWYEGTKKSEQFTVRQEKRGELGDWLYAPTWRRWKVGEIAVPRKKGSGRWLVFVDRKGFMASFVDILEKYGFDVVSVREGTEYAEYSENNYEINASRGEDYLRLLQLEMKRGGFNCVSHFWSIDDPDAGMISESTEVLKQGFYSLFLFSQQLLRLGWSSELTMCVFANRLFDVLEGEEIEPAKSAILGLTRVLPKECRSITCHAVDIGSTRAERPDEALLTRMLSLYNIDDENEDFPAVAIRNGTVWLEDLESLEGAKWGATGALDFAERSECVLILGGLGGIGLEIARLIASSGKADLALVSRRGLPQRSDWGDSDRISLDQRLQVEAVLEMEKMGVRVEVFSADISDEAAMEYVVSKTQSLFGPVGSVIHSAGIAGGGMIPMRSVDDIEKVLRSKVQGLDTLRKVINLSDLKKLVLCSSLSSFLGEYAQVDYCAANCVLDAWARRLRLEGVPAISINWDAWSESGMSLMSTDPNNIVEKARLEYVRKFGISNREGKEVLRRSLSFALPQIVVSTRCPSDWEDVSIKIQAQLGREDFPVAAPSQLHSRPNCSTLYLEPKTNTQRVVADVWQAMLGIEKIGINDDFIELGGHSLLATQVLNRLNLDYPHAELSLANMFTSPTVKSLASLIDEQSVKASKQEISLYDTLVSLNLEDRAYRIQQFLFQFLSSAYDLGSPERESSLEAVLSSRNSAELIWELKRTLRLRFYPQEFDEILNVGSLVDLVCKAFERMNNPHWVLDVEFETGFSKCLPTYCAEKSESGEKNPPVVFLHSAPRSGSTLLRIMLAGHSQLFSPPELGLLVAQTMGEWKSHLLSSFSVEGLVEAFANLGGRSRENARKLVNRFVKRNVPVKEVYGRLQKEAGERMLIDKTPLYGISLNVLRRSEKMFERPRYIHLVRHPYSVIDSIARNRLERIFTLEEVDPYLFAEDLWVECETNFQQFFDEIESDRVIRIRYENLVADPEGTMRLLSDFLKIEYNSSLIEPYEGNRMASGLGDPDILNHRKIDSSLANAWKNVRLPRRMCERSLLMADINGYSVPSTGEEVLINSELEQLKEMSEEELDRLIGELEA